MIAPLILRMKTSPQCVHAFLSPRWPTPIVLGIKLLLAITALSMPHIALSAANPAPDSVTNLPPHRYLLVVETSRAMQKRMDHTIDAVRELLASGIKGRVRKGDSLGVWTYGEKLASGRLPLQAFSPQTRTAVADRTAEFLRLQKCEGQARLDQVVNPMSDLIRSSQFITVILVNTGEQDLEITNFSRQVNEVYHAWRAEQAKALMPLITVLLGVDGNIKAATVSPAPFAIDLPPLPQPTDFASNRRPATPQTTAKPSPPLIVSGPKPSESTNAAPIAPPTTRLQADNNPTPPITGISTAAVESATALTAPTTNTIPATAQPEKLRSPSQLTSNTPPALAQAPSAPATNPPPPIPIKPSASPVTQEPAQATKITDVPPADTGKPPGWLFVASACLIVISLAGWWLWRRRRPRAHISLITQSLDRDRR